MISFINSRNSILAFAFVGSAGIGMSSFVPQVSAGMLDECHASSKMKVVACCKQHVERFGRPIWMANGEDSNCRATSVKCIPKKSSIAFAAVAVVVKKPYCYLEILAKFDGAVGKLQNPPSRNPNQPNVAGKP